MKRTKRMPSTMKSQHNFAQIPDMKQPRSAFNRSSGHKTTFDAGLLIPVYLDEILPGDTMKLAVNHVVRLATPLVPIMDNMFMDVFWFFCPTRLLWSNWQRFMGERDPDPDSSTDYQIPTVAMYPVNGAIDQSLPDYLGVPTRIPDLVVSALPFRMYNLVWNEWFRDENLQDSVVVPLDDGPDDTADYRPLRRGKRHDYFTSCLPWPQKGDAVTLPLGGTAPVVSDGNIPQFKDATTGLDQGPLFYTGGGPQPTVQIQFPGAPANPGDFVHFQQSGLEVDLSTATAVTINALRAATSIQRLLEKDARGGTRYTEIVRSHFGVTSPDQRLQRPEYLGGGSHLINMSSIPQTSETSGTPQGNLAAFALSVGAGGSGFAHSFTEHGYVMGLVSVRADLTYQQGLHRMWSRRDRLDFYFPSLAHLGEQAVYNKEIMALNGAFDDDVFGYQERWAEYRYKPSQVTGIMRSGSISPSLDLWHLAQDFSTIPILGDTFIEEAPPVDRVVATPSEPHFKADFFFQTRHVRPLPTYSVPGLTDRF